MTLPVIGLEPGACGRGLGRRLMAAFELGAIRLGAAAISLGAGDDVGGFYRRLGYAGRGPFLAARLRRLEAAAGDPAGRSDGPRGPQPDRWLAAEESGARGRS